MNFSERLLDLMKEKGVKWKMVSGDLQIGINQKRYWETHDNLPDGDTLKKLADYFGVSIPYLIGDTDDRGAKKAPTPGTNVEAMYIAELANSLPDQQRKEAVAYLLALRKEADSEK
jgi:transcriptional regulator with XRE-family HTH domain